MKIGLAFLFVLAGFAHATRPPPQNGGDMEQHQGQVSTSKSNSSTTVNQTLFGSGGERGDGGEASGDILSPSTSVNINRTTRRQVPETTLLMNSNMDNCIRVLGFSFAKDSGSAILGIPIPRDQSCDVWRAVNEAQENGHVLLSYAFMCEIKNIRKVWGKERCNEITATMENWWEEEVVYETLSGPPPAAMVAAAPQDTEEILDHIEQQVEELREDNHRLRSVVVQKQREVISEGEKRRRLAREALLRSGHVKEEREDG